MIFPLPKYLESMGEDDARSARCRYLIRLAALHYSPEGRVNSLSERLGLSSNTLAQLTNISPELAVRLEDVLGREHFPRELFRPDVFEVTGV